MHSTNSDVGFHHRGTNKTNKTNKPNKSLSSASPLVNVNLDVGESEKKIHMKRQSRPHRIKAIFPHPSVLTVKSFSNNKQQLKTISLKGYR